jgi:uncharacterized RDD family membrane protein YckC
MAHDLVILSPEKAVLTYRLAGIGSRVSAHLVDVVIITATFVVVSLVVGSVAVASPAFGDLLAMILGISASLGWLFYFALFEAFWNGQTLGKKAVGIAVRNADGTPIGFAAAFGRNALRIGDFLPAFYFLGLLSMFTSASSQRLGDQVAGTIVVHVRRPMARFHPAPHTVNVHPLEDKVGDLQGMTMEEYVALRRLCDRFPELSQAAQRRFLQEVWSPIAQRRGVPSLSNVHPLSVAEAVVMKYGRSHGLL